MTRDIPLICVKNISFDGHLCTFLKYITLAEVMTKSFKITSTDGTCCYYLLDIFLCLLSTPIVIILKALGNRAKVHGPGNVLEVVWEAQLYGVDGLDEWPGHFVLNYLLQDGVFNVEELVGGSAGSGSRRINRGLDDTVDRLKPRFIPVGTRTNISRKLRERSAKVATSGCFNTARR